MKSNSKVSRVIQSSGFTLIEVLLALAIISIALTALMRATAQNVANTQRIKEKTISHLVAMQGVAMVQLGLLTPSQSQIITQSTTLLGERWYWRVKANPTKIKSVEEITITLSKNQAGPYGSPLTAFRYHHE
ncbi:type II secretion system minor pseudopilin GspI [Legionella jordanis]|uniref:Type II secretion system protein I n=1 Tax=Legionella jordanis TaxID=456 RepID=A0A0W0V7L0_9GAMM|nr:type II secretion system minor pseudopilin GspI [Legionella jordanis]KTD16107.1 type II secretory pathway protein LspI [Legionella jordanis]RMX04662.1 type II secretion system protein GspI [Legionella jordanis]RMX18372.1 type II secretion system protein GspI [Legionella jordanis]VEH12433.1 general secretion pathway protein I [Legionella jordanis]